MKAKVADFVLIAVLLALSFSPLLFLRGEGKSAGIFVDGSLIKTVSLDVDGETVLEDMGTVVVSDGKVFFENSTCPDHSCEKTGEISREGQSIICLPNRVVIRVLGESGVDAVAG